MITHTTLPIKYQIVSNVAADTYLLRIEHTTEDYLPVEIVVTTIYISQIENEINSQYARIVLMWASQKIKDLPIRPSNKL